MTRDPKLHELCESIRKQVPSWIGSIPEFSESLNHIPDDTVRLYIKEYMNNHRRLVKRFKDEKDRCGEPTKDEKRIFAILKKAGY